MDIDTVVDTEYGVGTITGRRREGLVSTFCVEGSGFKVWLKESQMVEAQSDFSNPELQTLSFDDPDEYDPRLARVAAWEDVQKKAHQLFSTGRVNIEYDELGRIEARVMGESGVYSTMIKRVGDSPKIAFWSCTCPWGQWAFNRETKYGRVCSHALATQYASGGTTRSSMIEASVEDPMGDDDVSYVDHQEDLPLEEDDDWDFPLLSSEMDEDMELTYEGDLDPSVERNLEDQDEVRDTAEEYNNSDISNLDGFIREQEERMSSRTSRKKYTPEEELDLIEENGKASQLTELNLANSHYEDLL